MLRPGLCSAVRLWASRGTLLTKAVLYKRRFLQSELPFPCRDILTVNTFVAPLGSPLKRTSQHPRDEIGAVEPLLLRASCVEQRRFVARVKVHRFAGVIPLKVRSPKSEWYIQAEKEFLSEREQVPDGYIERWREEDLEKLDPPLREVLSLRCASNSQLHKWRKLQLCRQLQRRPFDTGSSAVQSKQMQALQLEAHDAPQNGNSSVFI